jgi:hypothetical protein
MSCQSHKISLKDPLPQKGRAPKTAQRPAFAVPEIEWVESLNGNQQPILVPHDTAGASNCRSSSSASPTKRLRFLPPEQDSATTMEVTWDDQLPAEEQPTDEASKGRKTAVCCY